MKSAFLVCLFSICLFFSVLAQDVTYTFDYQIDMEDSEVYRDSARIKSKKYLRITWLNSKDRNYAAMMYYHDDSTQNNLLIFDFNERQLYKIFTHKAEPEASVEPFEKINFNLAQRPSGFSSADRRKRGRTINGYKCKQIYTENASHSTEIWFTKDIIDAPEHAYHAIHFFYKFPPSLKGVPVTYQMKTESSNHYNRLIATQKKNRKIIIKDNVFKLEGDLEPIVAK